MSWRLAQSLEHLRVQVNAAWPSRSKDSDGSIGDLRHQHEATSDHNPWVMDGSMGVVTAIDITHDPAHGFNSYDFAEMLRTNRDQRIKYVISNRRIFSGSGQAQPAWVWRTYSGSNPHDHHIHISVKSSKPYYDDLHDWSIDAAAMPPPDPSSPPVQPLVVIGSSGSNVERLQRALGCTITGKYAEASETEYALRLFQMRHQLTPDGRCGPQTWAALETKKG